MPALAESTIAENEIEPCQKMPCLEIESDSDDLLEKTLREVREESVFNEKDLSVCN